MTGDSVATYEFPMEEHHRLAEEAIRKRNGRIGYSFKSAYRHLTQAWKIYEIDREMSLFRAITAEEEAASGLMLALAQQRYPGAQRLRPRDHRHKAAVVPFLQGVTGMLASSGVVTPRLRLSNGSTAALEVSIDLQAMGLSREARFATPDHPFNFAIKKAGQSGVYMFETELEELARSRGAVDIRTAIAERANLRNQLLYASDRGVPNASFPQEALLQHRGRVYMLTLLAIGVLQTKEHQLFAGQALEAFLTALGIAIDERLDYTKSQPPGPLNEVRQALDGTFSMATGYRGKVKITGTLGAAVPWESESAGHVQDITKESSE